MLQENAQVLQWANEGKGRIVFQALPGFQQEAVQQTTTALL